MKTKKIVLAMSIFILTLSSCTNESSDKPVTAQTAVETQKIDAVIEDIAFIADDQFESSESSSVGRTTSNRYLSNLPECATVSDLGSTETVKHLTITFGSADTPCLYRGRYLKGQIIIDRTKGNTFPKTLTVTFNNFYSGDKKIEGTISWSRTMIGEASDLHPKTTITTTNLTYTTSDGVFTCNGSKTREMTSGYATLSSPTDDVFSIYGSFTITYPNGNIYTALTDQATPLVYKTACLYYTPPAPFPVSGKLKISKESHYVTFDFGTGDCDNLATRSIDGGAVTEIVLEK